jgi:PPOX class probable F420-dependent enzyme
MDDAARSALDRERYGSLETFRKTGRAVATPVWFARSDGRFYVFTEGTAGKVKRLRNDPRVRLAPCNVRGRVHGPAFAGRAAIVDDPAVVERAYAALRAKYGWQMRLVDLASRLAGRYDARAILEIELDGPASD